ncbi:helix-turn-helix domain-containing protein [Pantoea allii]|uniref:helix-turn-helix domain-containing protein n=1 Tax=Pantoea allii TaxID=574096 RepID=UPI001561491F|nr:helix-turn-helix transcriptional regulator [Pantoea allii]NQS84044.1 helix-turn-helix transcriptional regulator [Pantoea allii]
MEIFEKLKAIRNAEGMSQTAFCQLLDMSISTVKKYEAGMIEPGGSVLMRIMQHEQFQKYALWMMTDTTAPEIGQVAPVIEAKKDTGLIKNKKNPKTK